MMRATLESTTDGILVTDGGGKVTGFNEKFVEMWRMPREVMDSREHRQLLEVTCRYFKDPRQFLARIEDIYASSPPESYDLLELADGRVFERFSRIQFVDERNVGRVWSFRDITASKQAERTTRFLADASAALAELTDYESTLQKVASLAVPFFADWCAVDMQEADGSLRRLAVTHSDPAKVQLAHELFRRYPPRPSDPHGVMKVLRTGEPEWVAMIPDSLLAESAQDEDHLRILRELGLKSYICVPLRSRARTLGALTFVTAESGRVYDATDLAAAEDLAHRAVIAIENARLLAALKESDRRKDEFLAMLAHELRNPLAPIRNAVQILRAKGPPVPELQWATDVIDRQVHQMTRLVDDLLGRVPHHQGQDRAPQGAGRAGGGGEQRRRSQPPAHREVGPRTHGHDPAAADPPRSGPDPAGASAVEPAEQRRQVHGPGRSHLADRRAAGRPCADPGQGHRHRHSREMLPRIFDMFTQVDRSLERSEGGLGIGLTLVQRLVEMHGGTVEAHSDGPGQGQRVRRAPAGRRRSRTKDRKGRQATARRAPRLPGAASWSWTTTRMLPTAWGCCCA